MSNSTFYISVLIVLGSCLLARASAINKENGVADKQVAMFVFGDSVYDPGNTNFSNFSTKVNIWPYGETFFHFPTGRATDGRILPDFMSMYLGIPLWKPYLDPVPQNFTHGANFAAAAAPAQDYIAASGVITFSEQLSYFGNVVSLLKEEMGDTEANETLTEAVYLLSLGGIDYVSFSGTYPNATETQIQEYISLVIGNITTGIKEIYNLGGRKFALQNVASMGCMPVVRQKQGLTGDECYEDLLKLPSLHNKALVNAAKELETELSGFTYLIFDYYSLVLNIVQNPSEYGFTESIVACCGSGAYRGQGCGTPPFELCSDPNEYVWFDGGHPTEHTNSILAGLLWEGGANATSPYNMKQLVELQVSKPSSRSWSVV